MDEKKSLNWELRCAKCGFEFSIMFDFDESEETKNAIRKCPCGCGLMDIVDEEIF